MRAYFVLRTGYVSEKSDSGGPCLSQTDQDHWTAHWGL